MDLRCTTDNYEALYARWLEKPGRLLDHAGYEPGQAVLDLCGGTGAISLECLRRGADPSTISLLDLNPRCEDDRITSYEGDANFLGRTFDTLHPECFKSFDLAVIRQAAAYLRWSVFMINWLRLLIKPGGKLVFNLFVKPRWSLKTYKYGGRRFFEASGHFKRTVFHVQASPGLGVDLTQFKWHNPADLMKRLILWFDVEIRSNGRTQTWTCVRRGTKCE